MDCNSVSGVTAFCSLCETFDVENVLLIEWVKFMTVKQRNFTLLTCYICNLTLDIDDNIFRT